MTPRNRRQERHAQEKKSNQIAIAISAAIIIGIVIAIAWPKSPAPRIDASTLCDLGRDSDLHIALIDQTDTLSANQGTVVEQKLRDIAEGMPENAQLVVHLVDATSVLSHPIFQFCKPKRGEDAHWFYENAAFVEANYRKNFEEPLDSMLKQLLVAETQPASPIVEAISALGSRYFNTPGDTTETEHANPEEAGDSDATAAPARQERPRTSSIEIHIFSDLIQHSDLFSQYSSSAGHLEARNAHPSLFGSLPRLRSAPVRIVYFNRDSPIQGDVHIAFWLDLFQSLGGSPRVIDRPR